MISVGIVGHGHIGQAVAKAHKKFNPLIHDPTYSKSIPLHEFKNLDVIYICVPSPPNEDGSCDTSILKKVLKDLYFTNLTASTVIISHTTAPPTVYKELLSLYPNLVHAPEFVTERNANKDYQYATWAIYGGNSLWAEKARKLNCKVRDKILANYLIVNIESAALYKYFSNSFLATKVSIATEWKNLANKVGTDWSTVISMAGLDDRIGKSHLATPGHDGKPGWAGACFPKDVSAIIAEAAAQDVDFKLLEFVHNLNKEHRQ